jgi:hypothetical protein
MKDDSKLHARRELAIQMQQHFEAAFTNYEATALRLKEAEESHQIAGNSVAQAALLVDRLREELGADWPCVLEDLARFEEYVAGVLEGRRLGELHAEIADHAPADPSAQ